MKGKGDLDGALLYTLQALEIDMKVYGPDHPWVATDANNIGGILKDKGDLESASRYTQQALEIFQKIYGSENPTTKTVAANLAAIKEAMK